MSLVEKLAFLANPVPVFVDPEKEDDCKLIVYVLYTDVGFPHICLQDYKHFAER